MDDPHDAHDALKALQDEIFRGRVLRARGLTEQQRLSDAFGITNSVFERMLNGATWQIDSQDREEGWREVRRRLKTLSRVHDQGRFSLQGPRGAPCL